MGTLAVETKPLHGIKSVSRLFMSSQLLLYHNYVRMTDRDNDDRSIIPPHQGTCLGVKQALLRYDSTVSKEIDNGLTRSVCFFPKFLASDVTKKMI